MTDEKTIGADEARESLDTIDTVQQASQRRAAAPRWYGIGVALIVATGFGLYAQTDPGNFPGLFIVLGTVLMVGHFRDKTGVNTKSIPDAAIGRWILLGVVLFLLVLFFGGIYLRRALDLAWIPIVTGIVAGGFLLLLSESERRDSSAS
ncbi:MAG: hypothetical protein ACR2QS_12205 [Woeseiaceae bacterium]